MKRLSLLALIGLLIGNLAFAAGSNVKGQIGADDIRRGEGTFTRRTSTGGTITLDKLNADNLPVNYGTANDSYTSTGAVPFSVDDALSAVIDVRAYGADPTGVSDSAAAIQAAIDTGKPVVIPAGTYLISTALQITGNNVSIRGAGANSTIIQVSGTTVKGLENDNVATTRYYTVIEGIQFIPATTSTAKGLDFNNFQFLTIKDVVVKNFNVNVELNTVYYWTIMGHCNFSVAAGAGAINLSISEANAGTLIAGTYNQSAAQGIKVYNTNGVTLVNPDAESNTTEALTLDGCSDVAVVNPRLESNGTGIRILGTTSDIAIIAPHLSGNGAAYNISDYSKVNILDQANGNVFSKFTIGNGTDAALEVYREGTWTPVLSGSSTAGTQTYSVQNGTYTRIGRVVFIRAYIALSALGGATNGNMLITGLPFASASAGNTHVSVPVPYYGGINLTDGYQVIGGNIDPGSSQIALFASGDNNVATAVTNAMMGNTSVLLLEGFYFAAAL